MKICARCKEKIFEGETTGESQLFGSRHILCEGCFFSEETEIDSRGKNDLPDTLKSYGPSNEED